MTSVQTHFANDLASAVANGLYQGIGLALVLWLAFRLLPRTNAATRHAVGFVALLVVTALPFAHFALRPAASASQTDFSLPQTETLRSLPDASATYPRNPDTAPNSTLPKSRSQVTMESPRFEPWLRSPIVAENAPQLSKATQWRTRIPKTATVCLVCVWLVVSLFLLARLAFQYGLLHRMKRDAAAPGEALREAFESLRREVLPNRRVRILVSSNLSTPLAAGLGHPAVLLPKTLCDTQDSSALDGILLHELAHLRRRDDWTNLVQQIARAVFFFYPAVWWISRRLTIDREIACDDFALAVTRRPKAYALLLTNFAGQRQTQNWTAAPAAWINTNQLKERISMILDKTRNASPALARGRTGTLAFGAIALAAMALLAAPKVAVAYDNQDEQPPVSSERKYKDEATRDRNSDRMRPAPHPPTAPSVQPPSPPSPPLDRHDLEVRLAELERLVETLVEQSMENLDIDVHMDHDFEVPNPNVNHSFDFHFDEARLQQAMEDARRAMEKGLQAREQAMMEMERRVGMERERQREAFKRQSEQRIDPQNVIEQSRKALQRELERIQEQRDQLQEMMRDIQSQLDELQDELQSANAESSDAVA